MGKGGVSTHIPLLPSYGSSIFVRKEDNQFLKFPLPWRKPRSLMQKELWWKKGGSADRAIRGWCLEGRLEQYNQLCQMWRAQNILLPWNIIEKSIMSSPQFSDWSGLSYSFYTSCLLSSGPGGFGGGGGKRWQDHKITQEGICTLRQWTYLSHSPFTAAMEHCSRTWLTPCLLVFSTHF